MPTYRFPVTIKGEVTVRAYDKGAARAWVVDLESMCITLSQDGHDWLYIDAIELPPPPPK